MKNISNSKHLALLLLLIIIATWPLSSSYGSQPTFVLPITFKAKTMSYDRETGIAEIKVISEVPEEERWQLGLEFTTNLKYIKNIEILNNVEWNLDFNIKKKYENIVKFHLSPDDTGRIIISYQCVENNLERKFNRHFVSGDTLEIWHGHPRDVAKKYSNRKREVDPDTLSQEELDKEYEILTDLSKKKYRDNIIESLGFTPETDGRGIAKLNLKLSKIVEMAKDIDFECMFFEPADWMPTKSKVPDDYIYPYKDTTVKIIPKVKVLENKSSISESKNEKMKLLEKIPLTDSPSQTYIKDGELWIRYKGESKFHIATSDELKKPTITPDSLNSLPMTAEINVCLDLRDSTHKNIALSILGELPKPEIPGFYHIKTTKANTIKLIDKGIIVK